MSEKKMCDCRQGRDPCSCMPNSANSIEQQAEPFELRLCEQYTTVLQPGRTYLFTVDPECPRCVAIAEGRQAEQKPATPDLRFHLGEDALWINLALNGKHVAINLDNIGPARWFCAEYRAKQGSKP